MNKLDVLDFLVDYVPEVKQKNNFYSHLMKLVQSKKLVDNQQELDIIDVEIEKWCKNDR